MKKPIKKLYSFDDHPEDKVKLQPWADLWIANALSWELLCFSR